jgi:diguanylate cyclase (GGDEF)-like protein
VALPGVADIPSDEALLAPVGDAAALAARVRWTTFVRARLFPAYLAVVIASGAAATALLARRLLDEDPGWDRPGLWLLVVLAVLGEVRQIPVWRGHQNIQVVTTTTFVFAIMLGFGVPAGVLAQVLASIVGDAVSRAPKIKVVFNAAQNALCYTALGVALVLLGPLRDGAPALLTLRYVPALAAAAAVNFLANQGLVSTCIALAQGRAVLRQLRADLPFHALTQGALYALAPVVLATVEFQLWIVPLLAVPLVVVWKGAATKAENEFLSYHDRLTGLPNRIHLQDRLGEALAARADDHGMALLLIDLDGFKEVNDTLGHQIGDELLKLVGDRLRDTAGHGVTVARLGGDEFAVLLPHARHGEALAAAHEITEAIEAPFQVDELSLGIEASVGIALVPDHATQADALLQRADVAMYRAKHLRSGIEVYDAEQDPSSPRRVGMLAELRHAIPNNELVLFYQPKVDLAEGLVVGVEALIRWFHPERGLMPPDDFLPLAERSGLIAPLTDWVAGTAIEQCRLWQDLGLDLTVAVNVSIRNLYDRRFPERLHSLLERWNVPASRLKLEITECTLMADPKRAAPSLQELNDMGISMSLDDFGTGYSSLTYLKRLPVRELKIDKSFVMNMTQDTQDVAIVRTTIDLARSLGLRVCAEGVEDQAALELLSFYGCHDAQGFHISRPLPPAELHRFVRTLNDTRPMLTHGSWARHHSGLAVPTGPAASTGPVASSRPSGMAVPAR